MAPKKKEITRIAKLELVGGQAKPGPALASVGINMAEFTKAFNDKTKDRNGQIVPVVITAYKDKSFDFITKTTPTTILLKEVAGIKKGSATPNTVNIGKITKEQALKIAEYKLVDMNANDSEAALRMIAGTAKQMGLEIEGFDSMSKSGKKVN